MNTTPKNHFTQHTFFYQDKPFRMLMAVGETWFVAADICMAIGLQQVSRAVGWISPACKKMVKVFLVQQPNRAVMMHVIDYIGLEEMMMQGTKQAVDSFQRWMEREVVPVLEWCEDHPYTAEGPKVIVPPKPESTGSHAAPPETETAVAAARADADLTRFSRRDLLLLALDAEDECDELKKKMPHYSPKPQPTNVWRPAKAATRLARRRNCWGFQSMAAII